MAYSEVGPTGKFKFRGANAGVPDGGDAISVMVNASDSIVLPPSLSCITNPFMGILKALDAAWLLEVGTETGATVLLVKVGASFKAVTRTVELLMPAAKVLVAFAAPLLSVMLAMSNTRKPGVGLSIFVFW